MWTRLYRESIKRVDIRFNKKVKGRQFSINLPGDTPWFHVIGHCDVKGPHVELPLVDAEDAAQNGSGVNANSHVQVDLLNLYATKRKRTTLDFFVKASFLINPEWRHILLGFSGGQIVLRRSCPTQFWHSSWHDWNELLEVPTRSSSNRPAIWFANSDFPIDYITNITNIKKKNNFGY